MKVNTSDDGEIKGNSNAPGRVLETHALLAVLEMRYGMTEETRE